jgi:predicted metal-binding membrane protein
VKNIFDLTKREQRLVIVIVVALVAVAFAKHLVENRSHPIPATASSAESATAAKSTSPAKTSPTIHPDEDQSDSDNSR